MCNSESWNDDPARTARKLRARPARLSPNNTLLARTTESMS